MYSYSYLTSLVNFFLHIYIENAGNGARF